MQRTITDWGGNIVAYAVMIVLNVLSNALPLNGQSMPEISARYASLFTPAGFTFSIWGVIYLALLVFVVWQAFPAQRSNDKLAALSAWFKANCLLNALWIFVWHYDLLVLSMLVMLCILASLIMIYQRLITSLDTATPSEHWVLYLPFSLYTGWITVATIANASILQTAYGLDDVLMGGVNWTLLKLALAGAIGASMILRVRDIVFALVVAWAAFGIAEKQVGTPAVAGAAMTLCLLMLILVARDGTERVMQYTMKTGD